MGGGDRPGRSDEYRDPESDDVDGSDAQRRLDALETTSSQQSDLTALPGIGPVKARTLREAGYETLDDIRRARRSDLSTVTGIGWSLAGKLKHAVGARTVQDRDPSDPPGEMVMPVKLEGAGTNHVIANGIRVDTNSVAFVELRYHRAAYYYGLTDAEFGRVRQQLEAKHDTKPVENVLTEIHNWKDSSGAPSAQTHEEAFKHALGIDAPIRDTGGDPRRVGNDDPEVAVACDLAAISQEILHDHLGDEAELTRGLRYALPDTATQILDNPEQEEYALDVSVLTNFTGDTRTAVAYFDVAARISATPADLAVAPDSLLRHRHLGDGELASDCEFQIRTEALRAIDSEDIIIGQNGHSLADEFERIPEPDELSEHANRIRQNPDTELLLPEESHRAIAGTVRLMADASRDNQREYDGVETRRAKQTLTNWLALYTIEGAISERERLALREDVREIVQSV